MTMESENNGMDLDSPFDDAAAAMDVDEGGPPSTSGKGGGKAGKWEPGSSSSFLSAGALSSSSDDDEDGGGVLGGVSPDAVSRFCKDAARSFFDERGLISHQINSYDYFVDVGLQRVFDAFGEIEVLPEYDPSAKAEGGWRHATVRFGKVKVERPSIWWEKVDVAMGDGMGGKGGKRPGKGPKGEDPGGGDSLAGGYLKLLPKHARLMKMSYSGRIKVETSWEIYTKEICHSDKFKTGVEKFEKKNVLSSGKKEIFIGRLPVMVKSKLCWLSDEEEPDECHFDKGGYFVIKGAEKTFIAQEERCASRLWIDGAQNGIVTFPSHIKKKRIYVKLEAPKTDGYFERKTITVSFMYTSLPLWIVFFALGVSSDKEICEMINVDLEDNKMTNILLSTIRDSDEKCENFRKKFFAIKYIEEQMKATKIPPQETVEECINTCMFPSLDGFRRKAQFLAYMAKCLLLSFFGKQRCDDRDFFKFKRLELSSELLSRQIRGHLLQARKHMVKLMQRDLSSDKFKTIEFYIDASMITNGLSRAFSTGTWNHSYLRMEKTSGVVATLRRINPLQMVSDMRKTRQQVAYAGMTGDARYPNLSYWGRICFISTPDGENCGLVKNLAVTGIVTISVEEPSMDCLSVCGMEEFSACLPSSLIGKTKVFLNGTWVGICSNSHEFARKLRNMRRRKLIHPQVEIKLDQEQQEIRIFSDAGRILRPLLIVKNLRKVKKIIGGSFSFGSLVDEKIVELIGAEEEEDCLIAPSIHELVKDASSQFSLQFTHCELDSSFLLALSCGIIPFANHNLAKRVLFQSEKHSNQAIGFSTTNPNIRVDTGSYQLYYPQIPLFRTLVSECLGKPKCSMGFDDKVPRPEFFNGQNAIVAVNVYLGYNQEDSIVMNMASLERGMFRTEYIRSYKAEVENKDACNLRRFKAKDPISFCKVQSRFGKVDCLDDDGLPYVGANLESGDIIIGKAAESGIDHSIKLKHTEKGKVQKVVLSANDDGKNFATVSLRQVRIPCLGDKFSSMHGQKGVIGFLEKQENLPFTKQGIVPDIVINPHAFPTRQTPGQLLEAALGKGIALGGSTRCATPFSTPSVEDISEQLHRAGFQRWGSEKFYDGRNGESLAHLIFVGPTFYQRLVHMSEDKVKFRNTGPVHPLTRQPVADRKRFGGLKFGEMERDCLLAHGAAANLHERLFTLSDYSQMFICRGCERVANVILRPLSDGRKVRGPYCQFCSSGEKIIKVNVPYGAKLLTQELFSIGICLKFATEES